MQWYEPQLVHGFFSKNCSILLQLPAVLKLLQICLELWVLTVRFSSQFKQDHLDIATV